MAAASSIFSAERMPSSPAFQRKKSLLLMRFTQQ
jgi:hypothetical protein